MTAYATYEYYVSSYGGDLSSDAFSKQIGKASAFISYLTMGRSTGETDAEQMAACAVADVYAASAGRLTSGGISSENNDGYSVTYADAVNGEAIEETVNRRAAAAARMYLANTGLLYRGVGVVPC